MSFAIACRKCGALSGPSVGVCPFCKSIFDEGSGPSDLNVGVFLDLYKKGRLAHALLLGDELYKSKSPESKEPVFVLAFVQLLIEVDAPGSKIRTVISDHLLIESEDRQNLRQELFNLVELLDARSAFKKGLNDQGEITVKNLLRRWPHSAHAHFLLGAHYLWEERELQLALTHLEWAVRLRPEFLRAWAGLGLTYSKIGNAQMSNSAFQRCLALETDPAMKEEIQKQLQHLRRAA